MPVIDPPSFAVSPAAPCRTLLSATISLALASLALPAAAQVQGAAVAASASASAPSSAAPSLGTVTVTANRRREPVREVPMQVDTLSADQLERSGARTLSDYLGDLPGVDVKTAGGAGLGAISIRGVSTGNQTVSTVGMYVDDVAVGSSSAFLLGASTALDMSLLDLNHIELLRGPQGTLYGAGAMGGVMKYVTNEPDSERFSGKVSVGGSVTHGGKPGNTETVVVNVPIKEDVAAVRVAAFRDHAGGYIDAVGAAAGRDIDGGETTGGRISLLLTPTNRLKMRLTVTSQRIQRADTSYVDYNVNGQPAEGDLKRRLTLREPYSTKLQLASADVEYDFGWARLESISATQSTRLDQRLDYSGVYGPLLGGFGVNVATVPLDLGAHMHKATQELRLTSQAGGSFEWLAGLYYNHEKGVNPQNVSSTLPDASAGPELALANIPSSFIETAAYGDLTWNATSRLSVTGGVRVARNRQEYHQVTSGLLLGSVDRTGTSSETSKTYLATVRFKLDASSDVYARAASGYRPGGPNAVINDPATGQPLAPPTFRHDDLRSYEVGYKADLLNKQLSIESALYDIRWNQLQQVEAINGIGVIANAGKAHIHGAELNATYRPTPDWRVTGSAAYTDAKLSSDAPGLGASGSRLPNSARWAGSFGVNYAFPIAGRSAYAGISERLVAERNAGFAGSSTLPNYRMPGYALTDLQGGIDFQQYQLALYVRNVFDNRAQLDASTSFVPLNGPVSVSVARPRTLGFTLTAAF